MPIYDVSVYSVHDVAAKNMLREHSKLTAGQTIFLCSKFTTMFASTCEVCSANARAHFISFIASNMCNICCNICSGRKSMSEENWPQHRERKTHRIYAHDEKTGRCHWPATTKLHKQLITFICIFICRWFASFHLSHIEKNLLILFAIHFKEIICSI